VVRRDAFASCGQRRSPHRHWRVTPDPASVPSLIAWGKFLQSRVDYLIVKNYLSNPADFSYWDGDPLAEEFWRIFNRKVISMEYHLPEIELSHTASVWRAQAYRRNLFAELNRAKELLLL
jgi:hypothetical protein